MEINYKNFTNPTPLFTLACFYWNLVLYYFCNLFIWELVFNIPTVGHEIRDPKRVFAKI
jgi:phosphoglycerol transferase MdoB-like AlkP superfamily enzyme